MLPGGAQDCLKQMKRRVPYPLKLAALAALAWVAASIARDVGPVVASGLVCAVAVVASLHALNRPVAK